MIGLLPFLCAAVIAANEPPQLELRAGLQPPPGRVAGVGLSGVLLAPADEAQTPTLEIGWDRIRAVHGPLSDEATAFYEIADAAWRARTRLERGDAIAAEPLFEALFDDYRHQEGATAAVIAEGLLRCRLRRGTHIAAIEPWLALLQARPNTTVFASDWALAAGLPPVVDAATGLVPAVPPMWLPWPAVEAFARSGETPVGPIVSRAEALGALYLYAARIESGTPDLLPDIRSPDPGVRLVLAIVHARSGDADQRQRARQRLEVHLRPPPADSPPTPAWVEAWCRAAIGRSLLRESSLDQQRHGVLELLHLPARFEHSHPYLAGLALAEAAAAMRDMGDMRSAEILLRELKSRFPTHPVHDWQRRAAAPTLTPEEGS
jgi:hypothetical protein